MRYHYLRFDIWICLLLSFLLSLGTEKISTTILQDKYKEHKQEHKVDVGQVGGIADENVFRAQSVEDLLNHDLFTVVSPGIEYRNKGAGYYKGFYMHALTLPSGEIVAARINSESVVSDSDSIYSGNSTLPVGKIIKEDLTKEKYFIEQIEYKEPLTRTDFYIDMVGDAAIKSEESFIEGPTIVLQFLTIIITFPIFHTIGSKLGIFPCFYQRKSKKQSDWE